SALMLSSRAEANNMEDAWRRDEVHLFAETTPTSSDQAGPQPYRPNPAPAPADLVSTLRNALKGSEVFDVAAVQPPEGLQWHLDTVQDDAGSSGSDELNSFHHGPSLNAAAIFDGAAERVYALHDDHERVLRQQGVLALGRTNTTAELSMQPFGFDIVPPGAEPGPPVAAPVTAPTTRHEIAMVDGSDYRLGMLPRLLVSPAWAARLGFQPRAPFTVVRTPKPLTATQRTLVRETVDDYRLDTTSIVPNAAQTFVFSEMFQPTGGLDPLLLEAILTGAALLFSLFVVAVSLALAAAETRDERDVLTVVGASPHTMRATSGRKAAILTALGSALAVPVGFLPVVMFVLASNPTPPLVFPWRTVLVLLVVVPAVAGVATTVSSAVALRIRPVRISTMAFD
ncbi:MAG: hypothetical protein M3394_09195, partial [Actinomycetota bacterium]|nr:hypothetical protein [Actinomycetota bacterium]